METSARIKYDEGIGGFLNPPTHPGHKISVETDLRRRPENRGWMSLSYAAECDYIPADVRAKAKRILSEWTPPPMSDRAVQLWLRRVFAHFHNCYQGEIMEVTNEDRPVDKSGAVHFIRQYYPDFAAGFDGGTHALEAMYPVDCGDCGHYVNAHANGEGGKCTVITGELHPQYDRRPYAPEDLCSCQEFAIKAI